MTNSFLPLPEITTPTTHVDFTIVMPALNLRTALELELRALEAQTYTRERFECIVVDDGSSDNTQEFLAGYRSPLQLECIFNKTSLGRGAARNIGWRHGRGAIVVFLDGDTLPSPDWLSDYARAFEQDPCDVMSGGRHCIEIDPHSASLQQQLAALVGAATDQLLKSKAPEQFQTLASAAVPGPYRAEPFEVFELQLREACLCSPETLLWAYSFVGANVAVRRSWLEKVNGFDQFLRRGEDTDLGIRLCENGARFGFAQGANAYHMAVSPEFNRHLDPLEAAGFFYRHPYRLVLLVYLWFVRRFSASAEGAHPALANLKDLTGELGDDSNLDIDAEFRRLRQLPVPVDCRYTQEELVGFYVDCYHLPGLYISSFLDRAVAQGLFTKKQGDTRFFDFSLVSNWLRYRAPVHEYILKNGSCFRHYKTMLFPVRTVPAPRVLSCRCRYEITIDPDVFNGHQIRALTNIPLPVDTRAQAVTGFPCCDPPDLLSYRENGKPMIVRYPWPQDRMAVSIAYEFDCVVKEDSGQLDRNFSSDLEASKTHSRPTLLPRDYPKAKLILRKIGIERGLEAYDIAKKIYYWILENTSIYEGPSGTNILDSGVGLCIEEVWLFVNLCRLAGVPARQRCGSLFGLKSTADAGEVFVYKTVCFSPFMHTWAEVYTDRRGWIPVDFCTLAYGKRVLTHRNLHDPELRQEIVSETEMYDGYYFGNVDPYRIYAGNEANSIHVSFEEADSRSIPPWRMRTCLKHRLTCGVLHAQ